MQECIKNVEVNPKNSFEEDEGILDLCDNIGNIDDKTWCYIGIAKLKKDVKICERLPTPHSDFTNWFKHWCYSDVAEASCSKSICEMIGSEGVGDNFRKGCFYKMSGSSCS